MEGDDDGLEEGHVLFSQWYSKATDDTGQNVQKLSSSIEFIIFMDKIIKTLIHCFSNHFSPRDEFGVQFVKDIFQIIPFDGLLCIEEVEELLNEMRSYINFERFDFN